jgi:hypothetical protein
MPSDLVLCRDSTLAIFWVTSGINGFAIKPSIDAFDKHNHEFEVSVERFEVCS